MPTAARRFWPGGSALGKRLPAPARTPAWIEVVGVAPDGKYRSLGRSRGPLSTVPTFQDYSSSMTLVVASSRRPNEQRLLSSTAVATTSVIDDE